MAETKKKTEGEYLEYQGKPLVREGDTIIYGDLNHDPCVLLLDILSYAGHSLLSLLIGCLFILQTAHEPSAYTGYFGLVERKALFLCHLYGYRYEIVEERRAADGASAYAQAAEHFGFIPDAYLAKLESRFEYSGEVFNQFTEVHPPVSGEIKHYL